jgi:catechol 2,3-dioxygenase-like lactoylglutathione lyase family enzyme
MLRGFATVNFYADDLAAARDWYAEPFGVEANYASPPAPAAPAYVEFRIGDDQDEIGFIDRRYTEHGDGTGFATASVIDPFGNILGVMHNPHYLEIVGKRA